MFSCKNCKQRLLSYKQLRTCQPSNRKKAKVYSRHIPQVWCHQRQSQADGNGKLIREKFSMIKHSHGNQTAPKYSTLRKSMNWNISIKLRAPAIKTPSQRVTIIAGGFSKLMVSFWSAALCRVNMQHSLSLRWPFRELPNNESYSLPPLCLSFI